MSLGGGTTGRASRWVFRCGNGGLWGDVGVCLSLFSSGAGVPFVEPRVALRLTCATLAEMALDARPQKPPILDLRGGTGGRVSDSAGFSPPLPTVGRTLAIKLPTLSSRDGRLGAGVCSTLGASSSQTRSTSAARTNAHNEQVVRKRARHHPEVHNGYIDFVVVWPVAPGCAVIRKMNIRVGYGRS